MPSEVVVFKHGCLPLIGHYVLVNEVFIQALSVVDWVRAPLRVNPRYSVNFLDHQVNSVLVGVLRLVLILGRGGLEPLLDHFLAVESFEQLLLEPFARHLVIHGLHHSL